LSGLALSQLTELGLPDDKLEELDPIYNINKSKL
jgi:hypothetical protein